MCGQYVCVCAKARAPILPSEPLWRLKESRRRAHWAEALNCAKKGRYDAHGQVMITLFLAVCSAAPGRFCVTLLLCTWSLSHTHTFSLSLSLSLLGAVRV